MAINTEALMDKLFKWKTSIKIDDSTFYVRVVSDQVVDDARRSGLLEARKLRRDLRDVNNDEYLLHLDALQDLEEEDLRSLIISNQMKDVMRQYLNTNPRPTIPPLGDNPSQEDQEEYEAVKESRDDEYLKDMTSYVEAWEKEFRSTLSNRTQEQLLHMARQNRVDQVCEARFTEVFENHIVANSVYGDDKYKVKLFTVDQYKQLPVDLKRQLRDAYNSMNIGADDIKN